MKKKSLIIGIIAIVFVVIICIVFMAFNNNQVSSLDEVFNDKYAKLYWNYMNTEEFKKENDVGKYTFIDLNFDKINELVFEKSNNGNKVYNIYTF